MMVRNENVSEELDRKKRELENTREEIIQIKKLLEAI
jgi:hypothetical protein